MLLISALLLPSCGEKKKEPEGYLDYLETMDTEVVVESDAPAQSSGPTLLPEEEEIPYEKNTVIESENFSYDSAMFIFTYFSDIYNYLAPYSAYYGLDPTISLGRQSYFDLGISWKDHLVEQTEVSILHLLSIAEYARSVGHEFPELDRYLNEQLEMWYGYAENAGLSFDEYIKLYFGDRVTEEDIRKTFAVQFYAYTYNEIIKNEAMEKLTDEYIEGYYEKNKDTLGEGYATKNVCHILLTADKYGSDEAALAKAQEILDLYNAGDKTRASFEALSDEYNYDSNNYYENVPKDRMVDEFEDWIYDPARVLGDTGIVKTTYGYHIMYFAGDGEDNRREKAVDAYVQECLEAKSEEYYSIFKDSFVVDEDIGRWVPGMLPEGFIPS